MAGKRAYGTDYLDDLRTYRARGYTVTQAAAALGISRRTAYRLLAESKPKHG